MAYKYLRRLLYMINNEFVSVRHHGKSLPIIMCPRFDLSGAMVDSSRPHHVFALSIPSNRSQMPCASTSQLT